MHKFFVMHMCIFYCYTTLEHLYVKDNESWGDIKVQVLNPRPWGEFGVLWFV